MTDKELLELAAKAAGIKQLYWAEDDLECDWVPSSSPQLPNHNVLEKWTWKRWNPITDDGDALRLAVKLRLTIQHNYSGVFCYDNPDFADKSQDTIEVWENNGDPYKATRRAIVRAAAEIGKNK
jgi:hypothetical protein